MTYEECSAWADQFYRIFLKLVPPETFGGTFEGREIRHGFNIRYCHDQADDRNATLRYNVSVWFDKPSSFTKQYILDTVHFCGAGIVDQYGWPRGVVFSVGDKSPEVAARMLAWEVECAKAKSG